MTASMVHSRADVVNREYVACRQPALTSRDPFSLLVHDIRQYLGQSYGIDSADVDPEYIIALMAKYTSDPTDWEQYARADQSRNYTRNLVDSVNGKANLVSSSQYRVSRNTCAKLLRRSLLYGIRRKAHPSTTMRTPTVS